MKKKELLKKDLPYLNAELVMQNNAYLRTIIEMQIFIVAKLNNTTEDIVSKKVNEEIIKNIEFVKRSVNKNVHNSNIMSIFN